MLAFFLYKIYRALPHPTHELTEKIKEMFFCEAPAVTEKLAAR
jgi:hypothetical protein